MASKSEKLDEWLYKLDNLSSQTELLEVCKDIYQRYDVGDFHSTEQNRLQNLLIQQFGKAFDLNVLKSLAKSQAKVSFQDISVLFNIEFESFDNYEKVIMLWGIFNSTKSLKSGRNEMFDLCLKILLESARKSQEEEESDYLFLLSMENMISYFKFYGVEDMVGLQKVWGIVNLYLESTMSGIRDRCLMLVEKLVKNREFAIGFLLPEILGRPWVDRNKYYLLAEVINQHPRDPNLGELFFKGLSMSLRYRHLFSPGHSLVKVLLKQEIPQMYETISDIFIASSGIEKRHMIEQWSSLLGMKEKNIIFEHIYAKCDFDTIVKTARIEAETFSHLVILRNIFSQQFSSHGFDLVAIDGIIREKWMTEFNDRDHFTEIQIYEIFIENVERDLEIPESLQFLRKFITMRHEVKDSCFRQNLLFKIPALLKHLAKASPAFDTFFNFIHELFLNGTQSDIYQHQIFALKLFQTVVSLFKNQNTLKSLNWDLQSNVYHEALLNLSTTSDFDDCRVLAYELFSKYLSAHAVLTVDNTLYQLAYPQFKIRVMLDAAVKSGDIDNARAYFRDALDVTENSLSSMKKDPLFSVKDEINLYKPLDCFNEFLMNETIKLENIESDGELIELVKVVADVIIDLINSKEQGLDFSKLDENLELLVEQSQVRSSHIEKDKKLLLHSFWHTLRACSELASNYGIYIIKNRQNYSKPLKRLLFCSDIIINILVFCCHKGAIESAAIAMGKLFKHFTYDWVKTLQSYQEEEIESITNAFMNKVLRPLDKIQTLDVRCNRGLILLHSQVLKNDFTIGKTMRQQCIKIFIERLTNLSEKDEPTPMVPFLIALFLQDLSKYFSDSELTDDVMPFLEQIILINFFYIRSSHWIIRNAALTLFGSLIPKLMKQRPKFFNQHDEWQFVFIHFDYFFANMPKVSDHILEALDCPDMPPSSIVLYLEFLANIEVRQVPIGHQAPIILTYRAKFWHLLGHRSDKIRRLAAICFAQFHQFSTEIPIAVLSTVPVIFSTKDENFKHGLVMAVTNLLKKLKSQHAFIDWPERAEFYSNVRNAFITNFANDSSLISYYTRSYLLSLLMQLKFDVQDAIVRWLIFERPALNDFGIEGWIQQVTDVLTSSVTGESEIEREISLDELSMSLSMSLSEA